MTYAKALEVKEKIEHGESRMCHAHGCPNRWSVRREGGPGLCSAHDAVADTPSDWPHITEQQQWDETERARMRGDQQPRPQPPLTHAEKLALLAKMRTLFTGPTPEPKAWAYALRARERTGEKLSTAQREMWRAAIGGKS